MYRALKSIPRYLYYPYKRNTIRFFEYIRVHEGKTAVGIETCDPKLVNRPLLSLQETTWYSGKCVLGKAVCNSLEKRTLDGSVH